MKEMTPSKARFNLALRMGDNALILGHRLSEWCGHSPALEEDIALTNTALDLIGQARMWLTLAGEIEGKGRTEDDLAMLRDAWDFTNLLLVEQPNRDFAHTIVRQFFFDHFHLLTLRELTKSSDVAIRSIAAKAEKEVTYHAERSSNLVVRLGDGSDESHRRMQSAINHFLPYVNECFDDISTDAELSEQNIARPPKSLIEPYWQTVGALLNQATLKFERPEFHHTGGKTGAQHSEHLGHLLTQMQWLQRAYPGAQW